MNAIAGINALLTQRYPYFLRTWNLVAVYKKSSVLNNGIQ